MQPRHYLVEEWKAKLAASAVSPEEQDRRFTWIRTIYSRVYRFLLAFYGDGEWRGVDTDGSTEQSASRMPFVEVGVWIEGARPKSRESIRQTLASIHDSNPGLAVAGTTAGVDEDTWVVVAARKKSSAVRAVLRRLERHGIQAGSQSRTTDKAILVRHQDFAAALKAIEDIGRFEQIVISRAAARTGVIGLVLLATTSVALGAVLFLPAPTVNIAPSICALVISYVAGMWLIMLGTHRR